MIDEVGHTHDAVYFNKLVSDCKAVKHHGDSKDGAFDGYDEVITVDLLALNFDT